MRFGTLIASALFLPFILIGAAPASSDTIGGLTIGAIINLLGLGIVKDINVLITLDTFNDNLVSINFDAKNPLPFELTIDRVVAEAGLNGTVYATFDRTFSRFILSAEGTANSGTLANVLLTQGLTASLDIVGFEELDLFNTNVFVRASTVDGLFGFPLQIDGLVQSDVPTTYNIDLDA